MAAGPATPEKQSYTNRLLKAKQRVWEERERKNEPDTWPNLKGPPRMSTLPAESMEARAEAFRAAYDRVKGEIGKVIVGHDEIVHGVLTCLFIGGHALLEGVPGLGKTLLVRTLAEAVDLDFNRIQFTPDLMPADIIGTNIVMELPDGRRVFEFQAGPIFSQIVLADEINRATPKTQSAMLEAMQEHSVTVGGKIHRLKEPFFVMATQNPIEQEGTYPLPEAQLDRFLLKLVVGYSTREELSTIIDRTTRGEKPRADKVLDGPTLLDLASAGPRGDRRASRAGLRHPARPGDPSPRAIRPRGDQQVHPLGSSPRGARHWSWPPRCDRCWMHGTTWASKTSAASTCRAFATESCSTSRRRPKGSIPTRFCSRCSTPCPRRPEEWPAVA